MTPASPITAPGLYQIPADAYHADPCPEPSASASILTTLYARTPAHAYTDHPRLNPNWKPDDDAKFDRGSAAHDLLLRGLDAMHEVDARDWRTKEAKQQRDEARAAGLIPLLSKDVADVRAMVEAARVQIAAIPEAASFLSADARSELVAIGQRDGLWRRAMIDRIDPEGGIFDYKTTSGSAKAHIWARNYLFGGDHDIQPVWHAACATDATGEPPPFFRFLVQEVRAPYCLSLVEITPWGLAKADEKVEIAWRQWSACMRSGVWTGYPNRVCWVDPPGYTETDIAAHEDRRAFAERVGKRELDLAIEMYRPHEETAA